MAKFEYRHEESAAALAPNWWRVLLVDGLLGLIVVVAGVALIMWWIAIVGWVVILLGVTYLLALVGRARAWKARRSEGGE